MTGRARTALLTDRAGTSAIEFAILMPVFIMLLIGGVAFGQGFYAIGSVQWAVERTARDLMVDGNLSEAQYEARVRELTDSFTGMDFTVSYSTASYGEIQVKQVRTLLRYPVRIPMVSTVWLEYPVETYAPRPVG
ncbi:MAG: TadE/TadG family type IV pilus assembly protein [Glycocaulis sp.]